MKVKDIMSHPVEEIRSDARVTEAAQLMQLSDVGILPIRDDDDIIGVLTDRDITARVVAGELNPRETPVTDVMSADVICCSEDSSVQDAATIMEENKVRRLLVLSRANEVSGILSIADIAMKVKDPYLIREIIMSIYEPISI